MAIFNCKVKYDQFNEKKDFLGTCPLQPFPLHLTQCGNLNIPMSIRSNAQGQKVPSLLRKQSYDPFLYEYKKLVDQLGLIATWILATKSQYNFMKSEYHIDRNINVPL